LKLRSHIAILKYIILLSASIPLLTPSVTATANNGMPGPLANWGTYNVSLKSDGTVWHWGYRKDQHNDGVNVGMSTLTPSQVQGIDQVETVVAGWNHTLALKMDGTVWAWGGNQKGELGNDSTIDSISSVQVQGLNHIIALRENMALKDDGTVWAWGNASNYGSSNLQLKPVQVMTDGAEILKSGSFCWLVLRKNGTIWAWGENRAGALGNGTTETSMSPVQVQGLNDVKAIYAGFSNYALKNDGTVWAWGNNTHSTLGNGDVVDPNSHDSYYAYSTIAAPVQGLSDIVDLAPGSGHTLALKNDGTVWSWGYNPYGQIGNGNQLTQGTAVRVGGLPKMKNIFAGYDSSMAVGEDGSVWVWGHNNHGQLGLGDQTDRLSPVLLNTLDNPATIIMSLQNSSVFAVETNGSIWGWGRNDQGQIGDSGKNDRLTPFKLPLNLLNAPVVSAVYPGGGISISDVGPTIRIRFNQAIHPDDINQDNIQLLNSNHFNIKTTIIAEDAQTIVLTPYTVLGQGEYTLVVKNIENNQGIPMTDLFTSTFNIALPVQGLGFVQMTGGTSHILGLKGDGTVWSWGKNTYGQLGDGSTTNRFIPTKVPGLTDIISIAAGLDFSLALKKDGTVWYWGHYPTGVSQDFIQYHNPRQLTELSDIVAIAAGERHSLALKHDGSVYGWGDFWKGQLGAQIVPYGGAIVRINGLSGIVDITSGAYHSLALDMDGSLWAWGDNSFRQVGNGVTNRNPVKVMDNVKLIAACRETSMVQKENGSIWAWGKNEAGQFGNGMNQVALRYTGTPMQVSNLGNVQQIVGGAQSEHFLALDHNGKVWGWGYNENGQIGNSKASSFAQLTPIQVQGLSGISLIGTGGSASFAERTDGTVWAWGTNSSGQLGNGSTVDSRIPVPSNLAQGSRILVQGMISKQNGGMLEVPHDTSVSFPAGYASVGVQVAVSLGSYVPQPPYPGVNTFPAAISVREITVPAGTVLQKPGTITMSYRSILTDPKNAAGVVTYLAIFQYQNGQWVKLKSSRDEAQQIIIADFEKPGTFALMQDISPVERLSGSNRIQTAIQVSRTGWPDGSEAVVLVRDNDFPDALAGAPLAHSVNAPILLTNSKVLSVDTKYEINRLAPKKIYILGSEGAVSSNIEQTLKKDYTVKRIGGSDRFATAVGIASHLKNSLGSEFTDKVVIGYGHNFPDTLAVSPWAAHNNIPILLTQKNELPKVVQEYLETAEVQESIIVGGTGVITQHVEDSLPGAERYGGSSRFDTAVIIARELSSNKKDIYIATGYNFPDALAGSALASKEGGCILLVANSLTDATQDFLAENQGAVNRIFVLGGPGAVPQHVTASVLNAVMAP